MKKRIFSAVMAIVLCITLVSTAMVFQVSADDGVAVSVGSASGKKGDTVTVTVDLSKNPGITALGLNIGYDTSKVKLVGASDAGTLSGEGFSGNTDYSASSYKLYWSDDLAGKNNTGTGTLATLKFELLEDFDESSPISVSVSDCYDSEMNDVHASASSGSIKSTSPTTASTTASSTTTKKAVTTTKSASATTTKKTATTTRKSSSYTTRRSTTFYDDSYGFEPESITESTTDFTEVSTTEESTTEESTTEESTTELEEEGGTLSKTKAVLIVLMVCFAIVGVAIIISIVKKSKQ